MWWFLFLNAAASLVLSPVRNQIQAFSLTQQEERNATQNKCKNDGGVLHCIFQAFGLVMWCLKEILSFFFYIPLKIVDKNFKGILEIVIVY